MKMKTEMGVMFLQAKEHRDCHSHHKLGQRLVPRLQTFSLQNHESMHFCCLSPQPVVLFYCRPRKLLNLVSAPYAVSRCLHQEARREILSL